eukprot:3941989-Rhodomonas_salina.5
MRRTIRYVSTGIRKPVCVGWYRTALHSMIPPSAISVRGCASSAQEGCISKLNTLHHWYCCRGLKGRYTADEFKHSHISIEDPAGLVVIVGS